MQNDAMPRDIYNISFLPIIYGHSAECHRRADEGRYDGDSAAAHAE